MFQIMNKILSIILLVFVVIISNFSFGQTGMRFWWRAAHWQRLLCYRHH